MTDTWTVQRFRPYAVYDGGVRSGMEPCQFGGFVRYEDYADILAEGNDLVDRLNQHDYRIEELVGMVDDLQAKLDVAVDALRMFIYETTHLSPEADDGSHWCKISKECLEDGRNALDQLTKDKTDGLRPQTT